MDEEKEKLLEKLLIEKEKILNQRKQSIISRVKAKAKFNNKEFNLDVNDIEWVTHCPILNHELNYFATQKEMYYSPSLDRVDNTKGYIPGNVRIISWEANRLKGSWSLEILERLVAYIKGEI